MRTRIVGVSDKCNRQLHKIAAQVTKEKELIQHGKMKAIDAEWSGFTFNNIHKSLNF